MGRRGLFLALTLAGCGAEPELRRISGSLAPEEVEPFLMKPAGHSEALDATKAAEIAANLLTMAAPGDWSTRLTIRRDGRLVAVLELNVSKDGSGPLSVSIRTNREVADAMEPSLGR